MKKVAIGLAIGVLAGTAVPGGASEGHPPIKNLLIVPGRSIGDVQVGRPVPMAFIKPLPAPNPWYTDYSWGGSDGTDEPVDFFIRTQSRKRSGVVVAVGMKNQGSAWPVFKTKEGLGLGSTLNAVKKAFPKGKWLPAGMDTDGYWQLPPGTTTFGFYGDTVSEITVGKFE